MRLRHCAFLVVSLSVSAASAVTIPTMPVGNPGNPADMRYEHPNPNGVGAVAYAFRIGKTEITNAQYTEFLNAVAASDPYGLYNILMGSDTFTVPGIVRHGVSGSFTYSVKAPALNGAYRYDDKPVVDVSSGDAMRFANWLHNGQPTGPQDDSTTEDGAYTLNGATTDSALGAVTRNAGARWWLPNEDEWYKAAYHKNDGVTGNYWDYPTSTNSVPNNNPPSSDTGNSANFDRDFFTSNRPLTDAGAYTLSSSPYGTFDQGGNASEWTETPAPPGRRLRGGSWVQSPHDELHASTSHPYSEVTAEFDNIGFRVASIPEPATICLAAMASVGMLLRRRPSIRNHPPSCGLSIPFDKDVLNDG